MAIDISGVNPNKLNQPANRAERNAENRARQAEKSAESRQEEVRISEDAQAIERLAREVRSAESFDEQRVKDITQAISEGRYPVDNQRVAEKFLELESQLY